MIEVDFNIEQKIRVIKDFPKEGISYKDITPLLTDKDSFRSTLDLLTEYYIKVNSGINCFNVNNLHKIILKNKGT